MVNLDELHKGSSNLVLEREPSSIIIKFRIGQNVEQGIKHKLDIIGDKTSEGFGAFLKINKITIFAIYYPFL